MFLNCHHANFCNDVNNSILHDFSFANIDFVPRKHNLTDILLLFYGNTERSRITVKSLAV